MKTTALTTSTLFLTLSATGLLSGCGDDGAPATGSASDTDTGADTDTTGTAPTTGPTTTPMNDESTGPGPTTTDPDSETDTDTASGCSVRPGEWSAPDWDAHVVAEMALRNQLADLAGGSGIMRNAENGTVQLTGVSDLTDAFVGDLAAATHPGFTAAIDSSFQEFYDAVSAGPNELMTDGMWDPGPNGGIWGDSNRGIDEGGIENRQIVDKGLFGAGAFYHHALLLTEGDLDDETFDKIAYIWGNNAALVPDDPDAPLVTSANYSYRQGFHAAMAEQLIAAKAYAQDAECTAERDAAVVEFFRLWETSMMSRVVYYINQMAVRLAVAETRDNFAEALHQLAEGLGLAAGFHGLPDPRSGPLAGAGRLVTDQEVEDILDALGFDMNDQGSSTTGTFVESLPAFETAQGASEAVIRDTYGVDQATIATWRTPTAG